jgi:hypothetical protein
MSAPKNNLTLTEITQLFYYDITSPTFLRWKISPSAKIKIGNIAGSLKKSTGYYKIKIKQIDYKLHRILYQIYHNIQSIPEGIEIDHKDGNRKNNDKENLRESTHAGNMQNKKLQKNNTSGVKGLMIFNDENLGIVRYKCRIIHLEKSHSKIFEYNDEGLELAKLWLIDTRNILQKEFANNG